MVILHATCFRFEAIGYIHVWKPYQNVRDCSWVELKRIFTHPWKDIGILQLQDNFMLKGLCHCVVNNDCHKLLGICFGVLDRAPCKQMGDPLFKTLDIFLPYPKLTFCSRVETERETCLISWGFEKRYQLVNGHWRQGSIQPMRGLAEGKNNLLECCPCSGG